MQRFDPASANPEVFFYDDFEAGNLGKWDVREPHAHGEPPALSLDPGRVFSGRYALRLTAKPGIGSGAKVVKWFLPGLDTVYARWYCFFPPEFDPGRNFMFLSLSGGPASDPYAASGKTSQRPTGHDYFHTALCCIRPRRSAPGIGMLALSTYHPDMEPDAHGQYWGDVFLSEPPFVPVCGQWYCMEVMVKCNTPGKYDGEQAAWIDGKQIIRVNGLRWRDTEELKLHCLGLDLYFTQSSQVRRLYYDNVALSRSYIGPIPASAGAEAER